MPDPKQIMDNQNSTNKSSLDYHCEPHDKRHEEFSKKGLDFGVTNSSIFILFLHLFIEMKEISGQCFSFGFG